MVAKVINEYRHILTCIKGSLAMDKKEKKERKEKLSKYVNFGNGKFKDQEIEDLEYLVENREKFDGATKTYGSSYKSFDSEGTYRVYEEETYTFHNDEEGIHIDKNLQREWDDGQKDVWESSYDTAHDILKNAYRFFERD